MQAGAPARLTSGGEQRHWHNSSSHSTATVIGPAIQKWARGQRWTQGGNQNCQKRNKIKVPYLCFALVNEVHRGAVDKIDRNCN